MYKTLGKKGVEEIVINKSKFIGYGAPVKSEEEAIEFISSIRTLNKQATHNCYAYIIGEHSNIQRFNDDGEPTGTAGIPMLEVLKKEELTNAVIVVTRYFGGIKLGGGGLIRAYTKSSKAAIDSSIIVIMQEFLRLKLKISYNQIGRIESFLADNKLKPIKIDYLDCVLMELYVKAINSEKFIARINDITNGEIEVTKLRKALLPTIDGVIYE